MSIQYAAYHLWYYYLDPEEAVVREYQKTQSNPLPLF